MVTPNEHEEYLKLKKPMKRKREEDAPVVEKASKDAEPAEDKSPAATPTSNKDETPGVPTKRLTSYETSTPVASKPEVPTKQEEQKLVNHITSSVPETQREYACIILKVCLFNHIILYTYVYISAFDQ